jgi:hypothetical protein
VGRVCRDECRPRVQRDGVCGLEQRERGLGVTARAPEPSSLEVDSRGGERARVGESRRLVEERVALDEAPAEAVNACELREQFRALGPGRLVRPRPEPRLAGVEIVEVPQRSERVVDSPTLFLPAKAGTRECGFRPRKSLKADASRPQQ